MNLRKLILALFAFALQLAAHDVAAQGGRTDRDVLGDAEYFARDVLHVWSSPARMSADDLGTVLLIGTGFGVAVALDQPVQEWVRANRETAPLRALAIFGEESPLNLYGRTKVMVPASLAMWVGGMLADSDDWRDAGVGCLTSNLSNTLSRWALAKLMGRMRPQENQGPLTFRLLANGEWEERSFPGGHAANAMTCTSFWTQRFDLGVAEPLMWTVASGVSLARIPDEAHWLSDTLFGMTWGFSIGKEVARRYDEREREERADLVPRAVIAFTIPF